MWNIFNTLPYFLHLKVSSIYCIYSMLPEDMTSFYSHTT